MVAFFFPPGVFRTTPRASFVTSDSAENEFFGQSTYTFSSTSIGAASVSRLVVVTVGFCDRIGTGRTISSATIGGVTATINTQINDAASTAPGVGIVSAVVPTGTTGDVVINFSGLVHGCGIGVFTLYDLISATPTDTDSTITGVLGGTSGSISRTSSVLQNNGVIVSVGLNSTFDTPTISCTSTVTEVFDLSINNSIDGSTIRVNGGLASDLTLGDKTVTHGGTNSSSGGWGLFLSCASWR